MCFLHKIRDAVIETMHRWSKYTLYSECSAHICECVGTASEYSQYEQNQRTKYCQYMHYQQYITPKYLKYRECPQVSNPEMLRVLPSDNICT